MFVICNVTDSANRTIYTNAYTATHFTKMHRQVLYVLNDILKIYRKLRNISANLIEYGTVYRVFFFTNT